MANERPRSRFREWLRPALALGQNPITLAGAVLTTSAAFTLIGFWAFEILKGGPIHPYTGIVFFLILPGIFVLGLLLMPIGALLRRRKLYRQGAAPHPYPSFDFHRPMFRRALVWFVVATFVNVAIMGVASYRSVEHMDSVEFCGETCHTVMSPEFTAFQASPHSRISCVNCHIGSGAPWFVRAKISGVRQVFAVMLDDYSRPIPSPVENLRPARETCEQCHWPQKFGGDKLLVRTKYSDDEKNTPLTTVLLLKIGGATARGRVGIHGRHLFETERIRYIATDPKRQVIPRVTYISDEGQPIDYVSTETKATPEQLARGERRAMDCMDCHNRPSHSFELPERGVDRAMSQNRISPNLPFAKKKSVELLRAKYPTREAAAAQIPAGFQDFYRTRYPQIYQTRRAQIESSARGLAEIYLRNVFPAMNVGWGTYPNNIGHEDFLGCFRCHDGSHKTSDGRAISDDCSACHTVLAQDEENPKVLADLGLQ